MLSKRLVARDGSPAQAAVIFATGESLIHACAKSAGITWPQPLALLDPALALAAEWRLQTSAPLTLVAGAISYIAAYV